MQRPGFFLKTKLLPPRAVSDVLERPRLTEKLRANIQSPLTLIAADAGCGKTTLIADFIRDQPRPAVWYQLDHTDADPAVFLGYLAEGIKGVVGGFGDTLCAYLAEANEELLSHPEWAADLFLNELLQSAEQPLILVLDDYHHIGRETQVHTIVDRMIQYSSDLLHVVITTRDLPPLSMMRRRSQSALLIIGRDDLLFTDDEVRELFRRTLKIELSEQQVAEYRKRTHGWITALQLVRQAAEQEINSASGEAVDLAEVLRQSEKDIFDYFAEEVFVRESAETRSLLLSLSLLDTLPLETCCILFPEHRCSAVLPSLVQKNVFLTVAGEGGSGEEYRLHPLFRDFLRRRFRAEAGRAGIAAERRRIARVLLENGRWEQALPFLVDAEAFDEAASVIADHGRELLTAGAVVTLGNFTRRIPDQSLEAFPYALLHAAEAARIQGEIERAVKFLQRASELFSASDDEEGGSEALHSLASIARRRGRIGEALELLDRAEQMAHPGSETELKCANTRGLCLISDGNWAEAEQQFRYALELAERRSSPYYARLIMHNLALPPGFRGDFGEALRWFSRIFRAEDGERRLPQEAIGHLNVARLHIYRGEFEPAARHLDLALELCRLFSLRSLLPEVFEAYANYYRECSDAVRAEEYYERAAEAYAEAGIDIGTRELNEERARLMIRTGDTRRARGLLESLIEARKKNGNETGVRTARLGLAQADLADGHPKRAAAAVADLPGYFHERSRFYDEALASMTMAEALYNAGRDYEAVPFVQRVLDLSARFDYDHWLKREMRRCPDVFRAEEITERLPADLRSLLSVDAAARQDGPPPAPKSTARVADLTVSILGPVEIHRDLATPFAPDAWTTRRARDIFCFIATSKHRRVSKDVLIDTFWPDDDPAVVEKNFHPTISHIRKALNSRQPVKQNFIIFRDGAYQLNPELSYLIDAEQFDRLVADAESAKRARDNERLRASLEAAYRLYRGEFMPGVYESWAEERRAYYTEQFGRVTGALARLSLGERRFAESQKYAAEALRSDPYREDMHRLTLKLLAAQGKTAAGKKHFDSMRSVLKDELGVEPSLQTLKLAHELGLADG